MHDQRHPAPRPGLGAAASGARRPAVSRPWSATTRSSASPSRPPSPTRRREAGMVESVEADNRGFDLISRRPHPEDPKTAIEVRFIEVKGRAAHRRDRPDGQRVQDRPAPQEGLLALCRLQLRHAESLSQHLAQSGDARLAAHRQGGALPAEGGFHSASCRTTRRSGRLWS